MFDAFELPEDEAAFNVCVTKARGDLVPRAEAYEELLSALLTQVVSVKRMIKSHSNPLAIALAAGDIQQQLDRLIWPGFLRETPWLWLTQYTRFLRGIELRLEKMGQNPGRDTANTQVINTLWAEHEKRLGIEGVWAYQQNPAWQEYRWMLEELRVSLFAQSLKTMMPVSEKRLRKQWQTSQS